MGYAPQGINRITTTVSLDTWIQVPFEWDDYERAVKLERSEAELRENYWEPAGAGSRKTSTLTRPTGHASTRPTLWAFWAPTRPPYRPTIRRERCSRKKPRAPGSAACLISTNMMVCLGSNITNVFHPSDQVTRMWKQGSIGILAAFDFFESNSIYSHTAGTWAGVVKVIGRDNPAPLW